MSQVDRYEAGAAGHRQPRNRRELIISYLYLRKTVGWIGSALPLVLVIGNLMLSPASLQGSMSGYYYTHMRNVFVGALCALGVFLIAYAGHNELDRWITNVAGLGAIGVAFLPTKPPVCAGSAKVCAFPAVRHLSVIQQVVGDVHLVLAAVTFIALGLMAWRFGRLDPDRRGAAAETGAAPGRPVPQEPRSRLYHWCGYAIWSFVLLAAASNLVPAGPRAEGHFLLVFEGLAVLAFGVSWFAKGQTLVPFSRKVRAKVSRVREAAASRGPVPGFTEPGTDTAGSS